MRGSTLVILAALLATLSVACGQKEATTETGAQALAASGDDDGDAEGAKAPGAGAR